MLLFNRYEYNPQADLIGKGGYARVYKALDKKDNTTIVCKIWKTGGDLSTPYIPVADRQKLIDLSQVNIGRYVAIEEIEKEDAFGDTETMQVCVLEWMDGGSMAQYYQTHKDPVVLEKLLIQAISGLSYLHENGIAHGNIKASNILIKKTAEGPIAKVTDFGTSMVTKPGGEEKAEAGGDQRVAFLNDYRSLGALIYELLTGSTTLSPAEQVRQLPPPFRDLIFHCLNEPMEASASADDTRILTLQPQAVVSDDTQLLNPKRESTPSSDDTQILSTKPKAVSSDDTQILPPRKEELLSLFHRYEYNPNTGLIGKGGFSRVYKAYDKKLNRWVALKIYKGGELGDRYSAIAEIRRVINLDHSNICRYLDIEEIEKENSFGEKEVTQICVMELLDGGNFAQYYNTHKDDKILKKLLNDVLNGLAYLHKNGIIHRDIKPANILIKETIDGPVAKITDFGISKISDSVNNNSSSALIVSIPYMAPEQLNVKKYGVNEKISYNLDLWSLGVTIYEIVTGKVLFKNSEQDSSEQIMTNIMAPELPEKINELSQPFRDIVAHCIIKDAKDRAQKAEELIVLLHSNYDPAAVRPILSFGPSLTAEATNNTTESATPVKLTTKKSFFIESGPDEMSTGKIERSIARKKNSAVSKSSTPANRTEREKRIIFISVVAAIIIAFLAITTYFYTRGKKEDLSTTTAQKADSTSTPPAGTPGATSSTQSSAAGSQPNTAGVQSGTTGTSSSTGGLQPSTANSLPSGKASQPSTANTSASGPGSQPSTAGAQPTASTSPAGIDPSSANQSSGAAEKKPKRNNDREEAPAPNYNSTQKYVLILSATQSCTVSINKEDYGKLEAGKTLKVYLVPGTYVLQATSLTNSAVYNGNLEVSEKNRSEVGRYQIPLH